MIFSQSTLLVLVFLISQSSGTPWAAEIVVPPVSINTTEGSKEVFTCIANHTWYVGYVVDGTKGAVPAYKGFVQQINELLNADDFSYRCNLTVTASSKLNNNSVIECLAVGGGIKNIHVRDSSDEVILRIQGPLSQVGDLTYSFIDSSTIIISWHPPFTLPGTDITGYNISAAAISNGITTNYFTSNSYYQLSLTDITDSPCEVITISVSGYNGLDGESTTFNAPSSMMSLPITLLIETYSLFIAFNGNQLCPVGVKVGSSINITLMSNNYIINQTLIDSQLLLLNDDVGFNGFPVQFDQTYTVNISFNGLYSYKDSIEIDTHDLVSARILNSSDSTVCVECVFSPSSSDDSCSLELMSSNHTTQQFVLNRPPNTDIARDCFDLEIMGNLTLRVLEQSSTRVRRSFNIGTTVTGTSSPHSLITDTSYMGSSISSSSTLPGSTNHPNNSISALPFLAIAAGFVAVGVFLVILMLIVLVVLVYMILSHRKEKLNVTNHKTNGHSLNLYTSPSLSTKTINNNCQ